MLNSKESKDRTEMELKKVDINQLPVYLKNNKEKFNQWILEN